jgi:hypothetical protein
VYEAPRIWIAGAALGFSRTACDAEVMSLFESFRRPVRLIALFYP